MTPPHIQIILGSIREGRVGEPVARWFAELAAQREDLTSELVDLREWNRKPVSYVSYGGPGGGTRAVEQLRGVAVELQQAPLRSQVIINRPWPQLHDGVFDGPQHARQAGALLDELVWADVLRAGRVRA
jgi:NAD(P)H-dependent FMN reductase